MWKIVDINFEKTPEMCCDSHGKKHKSTSEGYTETLNGPFSRQILGFAHAFTCYISCVHESQLFGAQI